MNKQAERASQHKCGCRIDRGGGDAEWINYCPLHKAAEELLAALHEVAYQLGVGISDYDGGEPRFMDKVGTAIVAAEGRDVD